MTSFSSDFTAFSSFVGSGTSADASFLSYWPPEAGCVGTSLSGVGVVSDVRAVVTTVARQFLARSITDGTALQVTHFALGTSGYDPSNPLSAIDVDPESTALISEIFRDSVDLVETATLDATAKSFVLRVAREELSAGIGEIGLIATVLNSPYPSEVGTQILFALAHQPLNVKTKNHVYSFRVILAL